jgi:PhnB protein
VARVSNYLNFAGNTEEAFLYYRSIFGGEFGGGRIARFKDMPVPEGMPPMPEADQNLVLHIELEILGCFWLSGTDAPESMGFKVNFGNNIFINLEPDTRAETLRLFNQLADQGVVTMPLADMFWGAYSGSCTDKFGVQWMFNCTENK